MVKTSPVPPGRIRVINDVPVRPTGDFVLYWMTAIRRSQWNFCLQRAVELAEECEKPLLVFEALRSGYSWASDRLHHFVIQGMADNQRRLKKHGIAYFPYLESEPGDGTGLLKYLAERACAVVGDDFPCFFLPAMTRVAANQIGGRFELVDSNGILPLRAADQVFVRAHYFRRFLQKNLRPHLRQFPQRNPLAGKKLPQLNQLPPLIGKRWPVADVARRAVEPASLADFPIDHCVTPGSVAGGSEAAQARLRRFLKQSVDEYEEERNHPDSDGGSGLSPYLHFGHISPHQIFHELMKRDEWSIEDLAEKANGSREGWWNASPATEAFLDELITWREVGYNMCWQRRDYDRYESLPDWAQTTLRDHERDPREYLYELEDFEHSRTHDELWNAAQRQLVCEGRMHNYLRMLWGKKILHWTPDARTALQIMIELNNKYALDGRNPNSYSGIFWVLGRYDRAWGPERKIFGKIRYMASENTAKKLRLKQYLARYGD
ncbi:MAG: deoxyribodipyrimidine photolyase [Pirellulaceae bacterium]|nr:deoxyribodipyrimidine photolyase [Pirellulaceae bacterium]